ncbi:MAG: acyltransferase [Bacteroidota bacterium]
MNLANEPRIQVLDGFRCIAVLAVIAYHYFYCFGVVVKVDPGYPSWYFFAFGYFGVQLFFMISGFVIYRSLEQSNGIKEFLGKRYIRLVPTLLLGSIITYSLVSWFNTTGSLEIFGEKSPADFLFSFTFIHPYVWDFILNRNNVGFVDGAYWSLWVEAIFYLVASFIYFGSRREHFLRNWFGIVFILNILQVVMSSTSAYNRTFEFFYIREWTYFSVGILFYSLWMKRSPPIYIWVIASMLVLLEIYRINSNGVRVLFPMVIGLWFVFLRRPSWLSILTRRPIQIIGLISYPLYVLHQSAGLVVTEKLRVLTNNSVPVPLLLTLVLVVFILLAYFVFTLFEKPLTKALKEKLL